MSGKARVLKYYFLKNIVKAEGKHVKELAIQNSTKFLEIHRERFGAYRRY